MSIGNITRGQTSYPRRGCTWLLAISYLLNHMMMRLLGKTHFSYFRICSFYFSHLSHGFFELYQVLLSKLLQDIQESLSYLDKISGLLLYSLGTYLTDIITAHLWEDHFVLKPRWFVYLWYTLLVFLFMNCMNCYVLILSLICWPMRVCIIDWRCTRFFWFNRIPRNCFFRLKKKIKPQYISWNLDQ